MLVGPGGEVHIFGGVANGYGLTYLYKPADEDYFLRSKFELGASSQGYSTSLDERGQPEFASGGYFTHLALIEQPGMAAISQTVTIPTDLVSPTLSFRYKLDQEFPGLLLSGMEVTITPSSGSPVSLFTSGVDRGTWLHGWADLSNWAGQTVTVAFTLNQAEDEWNARLLLDEISLGDWTSPVIQSFSPQVIIPSQAGSKLLHLWGSNLSTEAQVFIGSYLSDETVIDTATGDLLVTLPSDLKTGTYPIHIIYPDGRDAYGPYPLRVGYFIYSPLISR